MRKKLVYVINIALALFFMLGTADLAYSQEEEVSENVHYTCFVKKELTEEAKQLNTFLAKYFLASESHNIDELKELYASDFISGDGFNREKLLELIKDSWDLSPGLKYSGHIQDLKFDKNFATVELNEDITGETKEKSEITGDTGLLESSSRTVLYLRKFGKGWQVVSDKTLYEETSIKYGEAKGLDINLYAPGQVMPEDSYTISLDTEIPDDMFAVASIISENLSYPRENKKETFRQVPADVQLLERVVQANNKFLNELAIASVSFCNVKKDVFKRPDIDFTGTAVLIKRVNVLNAPASEE